MIPANLLETRCFDSREIKNNVVVNAAQNGTPWDQLIILDSSVICGVSKSGKAPAIPIATKLQAASRFDRDKTTWARITGASAWVSVFIPND